MWPLELGVAFPALKSVSVWGTNDILLPLKVMSPFAAEVITASLFLYILKSVPLCSSNLPSSFAISPPSLPLVILKLLTLWIKNSLVETNVFISNNSTSPIFNMLW